MTTTTAIRAPGHPGILVPGTPGHTRAHPGTPGHTRGLGGSPGAWAPTQNSARPGSRQRGLLRKSLYGTRDAALNWECELGGFLEEIGLRRGQASTCLYSEEARRISASVHGDDVTVKASREHAERLIRKFKERYEIKTQMIRESRGS